MTMEDRETVSLIGSDKVEGTNVYGSDGQKLGYIERVMIDKLSGKVSYAVLSFGLLGIGDDHYPLPWQTLNSILTLANTSPASPRISSEAFPNTLTRAVGVGTGKRGRLSGLPLRLKSLAIVVKGLLYFRVLRRFRRSGLECPIGFEYSAAHGCSPNHLHLHFEC